jgi:hypothetical protein
MSLRPSRFRFSSLLAAILALLLLHPYIADGPINRILQGLFFTGIMITAIWACGRTRLQSWAGLALGIPYLVVLWTARFTDAELWAVLAAGLGTTLFLYAAVVLLAQVLRAEQVTRDTIYGSLCAYLLLGIVWAHAYVLLNELQPGSFEAANAGNGGVVDFLYFSYVTLTTLGYGDVLPVTAKAKSLAMMESVTGVIFVAVQIARVVSLYQPDRQKA